MHCTQVKHKYAANTFIKYCTVKVRGTDKALSGLYPLDGFLAKKEDQNTCGFKVNLLDTLLWIKKVYVRRDLCIESTC